MLLDEGGMGGEFANPAQKRFSSRGSVGAGLSIDLTSASAGDLMVIAVSGYSSTPAISGGSGGWTWTAMTGSPPTVLGYLWKVLTATDVAGSVTLTAGGAGQAFWADYKTGGPTSAAMKTSVIAGATSDTTLAFTGFARASNSASVLAIIMDGDTGTITAPAGWAADLAFSGGVSGGGIYRLDAADYSEGTVTFTGFSTGNKQYGFLIELKG